MKITQKIINKIEGEATLKIRGDKTIEFAEIEFWQYRGVEDYLINRPFMDALVINPRICGICGHSHLFATVLVIEKIFGARVSKKASILREVSTLLEIVENHIKWFYITYYPVVKKDKKYILKAVKLSSEISKAIALIGGQYPHNSYMVPGGVTTDLTYVELIRLKEILKNVYSLITKEVINEDGKSEDIENIFEFIPKEIGKGVKRFLVLGENGFYKKNGLIDKIQECKTSSYLKNVKYDNLTFEVGPLARMRDIPLIKELYKKYEDSIYTRVVARMYEVVIIFQYLFKILEDIDINEPSYIKPSIKDGEAKVAIEAPRGSLIHSLRIENGLIAEYNIIVPTQFNLSSFSKNSLSPAQAALMGEDVKYIDAIFKCFDICSVCVSH